MRFRFTRAVAALSLVFGGLAATTETSAVRPEPWADAPAGRITPIIVPRGLDNGMVTLVLQLAGDPIAVRQADAGRDLSDAERDQIKAELKSRQDALKQYIDRLGGTILATYQAAYNGVKIRIAPDKADQLLALPNVLAVRTLQVMKPDNTNGVPLIGAPTVWQDSNFRGERVKIAIIDTGIDYTHANFGGPGTVAAYDAAHANETHAADPLLFGPRSPRVKGGIDLVGDSYDADSSSDTYQPIPHPDPNPLDCNGHGSHVAGTAAGSGVTAAGSTYTGAYNGTTISGNSWIIGPGVAPKADLYAIRVFGCSGSTDVTVDAIEWAVDHRMDVINMSLGSVFGTKDDPSAEAATNAAKAGVVVVASAGNSGSGQYLTGSPATGDGAISVAALDPTASFPAAIITGHVGGPATGINANGASLTGLPALTIKVINNDVATTEDESLGCSVAAFGGPLPANTIAVVNRGVCARVAKAIFGQQAGAAAVIMVNNTTALPPFEGRITSNPDDGTPYVVTIPFIGVKGLPTTPSSDGGELRAANGQSVTLTGTTLANPAYKNFASFSSGGPRTGDSFLKPEITAPGVSTVSTGNGTGNASATLSGTSMASPHVAGAAALTRQAHPSWSADEIKAAIVNTGSPADVVSYKTSRGGTGLVQTIGSTKTQVIARPMGEKLSNALNFGFVEMSSNFSQTKQITLQNKGSSAAKFTAAQANAQGRTHTLTIAAPGGRAAGTITVPAGGSVNIAVTLNVAVSAVGSTASFREVAGNVVFTPVSGTDNGGIALRVPYYLVPRALSNIATSVPRLPSTPDPSVTAKITNAGGAISGNADFFAWGLEAAKMGNSSANIRGVGVQSYDFGGGFGQGMGFAVNTHSRWSSASQNEFDIYVDVDGDGIDDYIVVGVDQGAVQLGTFNGSFGSFVFSTRSSGADILFLADAPSNASTTTIYVTAEMLCRSGEPCLDGETNRRISYRTLGFDLLTGDSFTVPGRAKYNVWASAISQGDFVTVAPGATNSSVVIAIDSDEWRLTPSLGSMIVSTDNKAGAGEAQLIRLSPRM
jgi:minor extracellular serine protease Vpr